MSGEENKAAERRMTEELWNQRNFGTVDELVAPDVVEHNPVLPGQGDGREGFKQSVKVALAAFPDAQITNEELIAEGDKGGAALEVPSVRRPDDSRVTLDR